MKHSILIIFLSIVLIILSGQVLPKLKIYLQVLLSIKVFDLKTIFYEINKGIFPLHDD